MTKSKNTKRALLMSALSMMLCIAMLAGTTFAWFTDTVTSGMNKIVAGNLDIELEYRPVTVNADGTTTLGDWTAVPTDESLFKSADETLWEPGHTEYVYLRVRNAGTLALKYIFSINVTGTGENGEEKEYTSVIFNTEKNAYDTFLLSDYLVFNQTKGVAEISKRDDLWLENAEAEKKELAKEKADRLAALGGKGVLLPGATEEMTLAVYMPTCVGNEANQLTSARKGEEGWEEEGAPTIYLGLNVIATQAQSESDSFGNDYDASADGKPDHPDWNFGDPNKVTAPVNPDGDTELNIRNVTVSVPKDAVVGNILSLTVEPTDTLESIPVDPGKTAKTFEINVQELKEDNSAPIKVMLTVEKGLTDVNLYHKEIRVDDNEAYNFKYNPDTGIITFTTTSFSPFTVVYNKPFEAPAPGTDTNGTSYTPPVQNDDGTLTFTPTPEAGDNTPNITFTADPKSKELTLTSGMDYNGEVTLPAAITGEDGTVYPLTAIADRALGTSFSNQADQEANQNIISITIPDTVEFIGEYAFAGCAKLKSVTIPNSVTTISEGAFSEAALEEVTLPESITEIPVAAFSGCDKLTTVEIPNSITKIGNLAFSSCTALTSIEIPDSVTSIENGAFNGSGLESVTIPASVKELGSRVFSGCESLTQLIIPNTVTKMGNLYLQNCKKLEELVLPACVNKLIPPNSAFMGCDSLKKIYYFATELKSTGSYSSSNNGAFEQAAKYVCSDSTPTDSQKPQITVRVSTGGTKEFVYWYWHMVDGVPTPWPEP